MNFLNTTTGEIKSDVIKLLIGADEINSTVRKVLYPNDGPPICQGLHTWRGLTSVDKLCLDGRTMICMGNPDTAYFIMYPLNNNLISWACVSRVKQEDTSFLAPDKSEWTTIGDWKDFLPFIKDMKLDFIDIEQIIKSSTVINQFPITNRNIISQWTFNGVSLIGDAAHPMYPNGGNGASQCILDAHQLYLSFIHYSINNETFQDYENNRRPLTDKFILLARQYGPDKILKIIDERLPNISDIISSEEIQSIIYNYKQTSGQDKYLLNNKDSLS
ncbi:unnamed protein product [Adineta steineri]|uniref:FAD-binding domain-containing protein n=1 Tax=Adineta steineri TaxID=433720 RepID=A0A813QZE6_9BILA|nr:unnamed protein product [Adineta steineri]